MDRCMGERFRACERASARGMLAAQEMEMRGRWHGWMDAPRARGVSGGAGWGAHQEGPARRRARSGEWGGAAAGAHAGRERDVLKPPSERLREAASAAAAKLTTTESSSSQTSAREAVDGCPRRTRQPRPPLRPSPSPALDARFRRQISSRCALSTSHHRKTPISHPLSAPSPVGISLSPA